jgi:hypothetical protein
MWDVTLCRVAVITRHCAVTLCLKSTRLHGVTSQKIVVLIESHMSSSDLQIMDYDG